MTIQQREKDYLAGIRASYAITATDDLCYAMTQLAQLYIGRGWTQVAADILAFILLQNDIPTDIHEQADNLFDGLERSICPRVIWDAKAFAADMDWQGMVEYVLDNDLS